MTIQTLTAALTPTDHLTQVYPSLLNTHTFSFEVSSDANISPFFMLIYFSSPVYIFY